MTDIAIDLIQLKRGKATDLESLNPTLQAGELVIVTDGSGIPLRMVSGPLTGSASYNSLPSLGGGGEASDWETLVEEPGSATLPGYVDGSGLGLPTAFRVRTLSDGRVEFGGAGGYLDGMGAPTNIPTDTEVCTLPAGLWPIVKPPVFGWQWNPVSLGGDDAVFPVRIEISPADGIVAVSGAVDAGAVLIIPNVTFDPQPA